MKKLALIIIALIVATMAFAQDNPLTAYMQDANVANFKAAVDYIAENDAKEPESLRLKLTLAFIANHEVKRVMALANTNLDQLSAGERFSLGNLYLGMDNYAEAIKIYDNINREFPNWSCPWRHKGEALYKSKDFKAAVKALEKSVETNKEHYDAYVWLAFAQYEIKKYKDARKSLETAFALDAEEEGSHFDEELPEEHIMELYEKIKKKTK